MCYQANCFNIESNRVTIKSFASPYFIAKSTLAFASGKLRQEFLLRVPNFGGIFIDYVRNLENVIANIQEYWEFF